MAGATMEEAGHEVAEPATDAVVRVLGVSKTFPGTKALDAVDLTVVPGEVHALVGANGSGKSTLIKVLAGFYAADKGSEAWIDGVSFDLADNLADRPELLSFVHQDLGLVLELDALDNLALHGGFRTARFGRVNWREQRRVTEELLAPFDVSLDLRRPLAEATPVERTVVAIAAALQGRKAGRGLLVLDEPTAVLPAYEVTRLFKIIKDLRANGVSILYVSHRLDEIFELADRVTVLRNGRNVLTDDMAAVTKKSLVAAMLGFEMEPDYRAPVVDESVGAPVLEVRDLIGRYAAGVSFTLGKGEILGLAGLGGSGREEIPYALAGALEYPVAGEVHMAGAEEAWHPVGHLGGLPLGFVPADRGGEGVIENMSVGENLSLSVLDRLGSKAKLDHRGEAQLVAQWAERLGVKMGDAGDPIGTLSGGNQQKVLIGRCLATAPEVLVLCEPTAGVDVGARRGIYDLLAKEARNGLSILVASTDLDDLLAICTRVLVLRQGVISHEFEGDGIVEHAIVHAIEDIEVEGMEHYRVQ